VWEGVLGVVFSREVSCEAAIVEYVDERTEMWSMMILLCCLMSRDEKSEVISYEPLAAITFLVHIFSSFVSLH